MGKLTIARHLLIPLVSLVLLFRISRGFAVGQYSVGSPRCQLPIVGSVPRHCRAARTSLSFAKSPREHRKELRGLSFLEAVKRSNAGATSEKPPSHWSNSSDVLQLKYHDEPEGTIQSDRRVSMVRFVVRGNPRPLVRHRTGRGFMYNPSAGLQDSFRNVVEKLLFSESVPSPLFREDDSLAINVIFRLKRPKKHFVGNKPGPGRLRESAPPQNATTRTDVDNLVKFVLDSMNEVLYPDDRQIASIQVAKLFDNEEDCLGSTEVILRAVDENELKVLVSRMEGES